MLSYWNNISDSSFQFCVITHSFLGLLAQLVEHCTGIAEVMGSNPIQAWIFSGPIFTTAEVVFITVKIAFVHVFIRSSNIWLSYITVVYSKFTTQKPPPLNSVHIFYFGGVYLLLVSLFNEDMKL